MGFCVQQSCRNYYLLEWKLAAAHSPLPPSATGSRFYSAHTCSRTAPWEAPWHKTLPTELVTCAPFSLSNPAQITVVLSFWLTRGEGLGPGHLPLSSHILQGLPNAGCVIVPDTWAARALTTCGQGLPTRGSNRNRLLFECKGLKNKTNKKKNSTVGKGGKAERMKEG